MNTAEAIKEARAIGATTTDKSLVVYLDDGRQISVPLEWYPRLMHGNSTERAFFELIGNGIGIRWPALDEDISVESILAGTRSGESQSSLARWKEELDRCRQTHNTGPWGDSIPLPDWWKEEK